MSNELHVAEFKKALSLVKPATSAKDFIPIFSNYCFNGKTIVGYSEPIGIELEFESGIRGGIKGDTLASWVSALPESAKISFIQDNELINLKSDRSKMELSCVDEDEFIYEKPKENGLKIDIDKEFIKALDSCLLSINSNSDNPSMAGVTVTKVEETIFFHSTNGTAISEYTVPTHSSENFFTGTVILPARFCTVLSKTFKELDADTVTGYLNPTSIIVNFDGNYKLSLWSKLLDTSKSDPLDFEAEIGRALDGFDFGRTFEVTENLIQTMTRLLSVYSTSTTESRLVKFDSLGDEIILSVKKSNLDITESVEVDTKQPKLSATIDLEKLLNALQPGCGMAMLPNLVVVTSDQFTYLQAYKNG